MPSVIPDGKTIRKQSDAALAAYIHHGHRLYRYWQPHKGAQCTWRLPKCEINTH